MLKRIAAALATTIAFSGPVQAAPQGLNASHLHLWNSLERQGVAIFINPNLACEGQELDLDGAYFYVESENLPVLFVCQDNRTGVDGQEVAWTANDLDTLRHEAFHYLQDCIDGDVSFTLTPFHDGDGPAPGTDDYFDVINALGLERAIMIETFYREHMNADAQVVRLEHEAFLMADIVEAGNIGETINTFCPIN